MGRAKECVCGFVGGVGRGGGQSKHFLPFVDNVSALCARRGCGFAPHFCVEKGVSRDGVALEFPKFFV